MSHILRPPSERTFPIADALAGIPRCVMLLESAILELLSNPHDENRRNKVRELVRSLHSGCPECGFKETGTILRKLTSHLAVSPGGGAAVQRSLADRMLEQVALLKAHAQVRRP